MKTRKQVMDLANKLGVEVDHDTLDIAWNTGIYTPKGLMLSSTQCHCAVNYEFITGQDKREHWQAVYNDLSYGVEPCDNPQCDTCENY